MKIGSKRAILLFLAVALGPGELLPVGPVRGVRAVARVERAHHPDREALRRPPLAIPVDRDADRGRTGGPPGGADRHRLGGLDPAVVAGVRCPVPVRKD